MTRALIFILIVFVSFVSAQTPFEQANQAANRSDYQQALRIYKQLLSNTESESFIAKIHFNIGICSFHLKQTNEAVASFEKAIIASRGAYQKAFYALGMAQTKLQNWQSAEAAFLDSLRLKTDDGEAWFDLGLIYLERKNFAAAEQAFRYSIKYQSVATADAHNNLGVILTINGDYAAAEKEFKTALFESNGASVEARNNLQLCLFYKQNDRKDLIAKLEFGKRIKNTGV